MSKFDKYPVTRLFTSTSHVQRPEHLLSVDAGSSLSEVFVIDGGFNMVARAQGKLEKRLPAGEYMLKYRAGDRYQERWINLDKDQQFSWYEAPIPNTSAPISERAGWPQDESLFAENLRHSHNLSIVIRDETGAPPKDDVRVLRVDGKTIGKMSDPKWQRGAVSRVIAMGENVAPGPYLLMVATRDVGQYLMPLWVAPDCSTQVFMTRNLLGYGASRRKGPHLASSSIFIATPNPPWEEIKRLLGLAETAKSVLSYDRPIFPSIEEIEQSLDNKYLCPILGLLAGHLLWTTVEEYEARSDPQARKLRKELETVVQNLGRLLPGSPDVGALEIALGRPGNADFSVPPMLAHSWAIILATTPSPIPPGSYADRIRPAISATRPWLIWNAARMTPATTKVTKKRKAAISLPPELAEAVRQLGKHMQVKVGSNGKISLVRSGKVTK